MDLSWIATTSSRADGYRIMRSTISGGPYSEVAVVSGKDSTTHSDANLELNTTYHYLAKTTYTGWNSQLSIEASASTPLICL